SQASAAGTYRDALAKEVVAQVGRVVAIAAAGPLGAIKDPTSALLAKAGAGLGTSLLGTGVERAIRGGDSMGTGEILKGMAQSAISSATAVGFGLESNSLKSAVGADDVVSKAIVDQAIVGSQKAVVGGTVKGGVDQTTLRKSRMQDDVAKKVEDSLAEQVVAGPTSPLISEGTSRALGTHKVAIGQANSEIGAEGKTLADRTALEGARAKGVETVDSRRAGEEAGKKPDPKAPTAAEKLKKGGEGVVKAEGKARIEDRDGIEVTPDMILGPATPPPLTPEQREKVAEQTRKKAESDASVAKVMEIVDRIEGNDPQTVAREEKAFEDHMVHHAPIADFVAWIEAGKPKGRRK
ncbi:MAG: hypothetical protein ACHQ02_10615, partial [Candidatus Limnocylindrales bacterium]